MAGAIILKITHGYTVQEGSDPYVEIADRVLDEFAKATTPGAFLVDAVPILRYVPSWFPGADFQKLAVKWRASLTHMVEAPFALVKKHIVRFPPMLVSLGVARLRHIVSKTVPQFRVS